MRWLLSWTAYSYRSLKSFRPTKAARDKSFARSVLSEQWQRQLKLYEEASRCHPKPHDVLRRHFMDG